VAPPSASVVEVNGGVMFLFAISASGSVGMLTIRGRRVADVHLPEDRHDTVLAIGFAADVPQGDHLVEVSRVLEGALEERNRVHLVAGEGFLVGAYVPTGLSRSGRRRPRPVASGRLPLPRPVSFEP
jgi:hypothetical protein